jgi:YidC/Oxa1 family membrane protein insertase
MWNLLIVDPITNLLLIFYKFLGNQTILAVAMLTLLVRLALLPLMLSQQRTMRKQREMQPKLQKLQEKYKNEQEKLAKEQMKLYREAGFNPASGCLPLFIQLPLMFGLYQAITRALAKSPLELLNLPSHIYRAAWLPNLSTLPPLQSQFLWLDLALPDPYYVLPILVVVTAWFQQRLISQSTPSTGTTADEQAQAMTQSMQITMPLFLGFISMNYAAGLSVYFVISNLIGILQYYIINRRFAEEDTESEAAKDRKAKAKAKA